MSQFGTIKKSDNTSHHGDTLQKLGYTVTDVEDHFRVEVSEFLKEHDLSETPEEVIREMIAKKQAFTYASKVLFQTDKGPKAYNGVVLCNKLESLMKHSSALVMHAEKTKKAAAKPSGSVLDLIG